MRFMSDEDFALPVVRRLRELGHDVLTAHEAGLADEETPDSVILSFAIEHGRCLITYNRRHFRRLHREQPSHAGMILCTRDSDTMRQAERIDTVVAGISDLRGLALRVVRPHPSDDA